MWIFFRFILFSFFSQIFLLSILFLVIIIVLHILLHFLYVFVCISSFFFIFPHFFSFLFSLRLISMAISSAISHRNFSLFLLLLELFPPFYSACPSPPIPFHFPLLLLLLLLLHLFFLLLLPPPPLKHSLTISRFMYGNVVSIPQFIVLLVFQCYVFL